MDDFATDDCTQADDLADCGDAPVVDMGAYEFVPGVACPGDGDGSGDIGTNDLLGMLAVWGMPDDTFDLDGSGVVDTPDLLALLGAWGGCVE